MNVVVFDLSTIQYRISARRGQVVAVAATGEILSRVDISPTIEHREAAYLAANAALDQARVLRDGVLGPIGLYNPYSGEVSVGAVPATRVYSAGHPIELEAEGTMFELDDGELVGESVTLMVVTPTMARTSRALAAHSL